MTVGCGLGCLAKSNSQEATAGGNELYLINLDGDMSFTQVPTLGSFGFGGWYVLILRHTTTS